MSDPDSSSLVESVPLRLPASLDSSSSPDDLYSSMLDRAFSMSAASARKSFITAEDCVITASTHCIHYHMKANSHKTTHDISGSF